MSTPVVTNSSTFQHRSTLRRGFTLIELLIVLVIFGLLAAILLPLFAGAREGGYRGTCLSNERQLILGTLAYTADSDSVFPNNKSLENTGLSPGRGRCKSFHMSRAPPSFTAPMTPRRTPRLSLRYGLLSSPQTRMAST